MEKGNRCARVDGKGAAVGTLKLWSPSHEANHVEHDVLLS